MTNSFYLPSSALVIVAHPDDAEFGCAGTIARWVKGGCRVGYVLCTSGDVGIAQPGIDRATAISIREAEQTAAADLLGVQSVVFLREPDGMLQNTLELRRKLVREIRRFRPEVVLCMDPTALFIREDYINHPDHRAAGTASVDAIFPAAGQPNLFEELATEGLTAHKPRKVYVITFGQPSDTFVNITDTIEQKIAALQAHVSQFPFGDPGERVRQWSAALGKGKEMDYAETFRVITLESDADWARYGGDVAARYA
jgi:LmbE family N-acetylglucosaminyl deacetylase